MGPGSISPASRLVLLVVGIAILLAVVAASRPRPGPGPSASTAWSSPSPRATGSPVHDASQWPVTPPPSSSPPAGQRSLPELLAMLDVAAEERTGYERALFPHWLDADGDGCDTRREVLFAEAVDPPSIGPGCELTGGRWVSLYDGEETTDPSTFQVDHVVALAEGWASGASGWSPDRRTRFANDLDVDWALVAVSAASNREKSDLDPADWLPSRVGADCDFLAMWLAVKVRWSLSIDPVEQSAIAREIPGCAQRMAVVLAP
jgi:hypothetical protein